jgi:serine/threonine-protein kinase
VSEGRLSFGAYQVVRKLGQGGMGEVFLGEHSLIGRRAAIKVLHPERSAQRDSVERFFNEARATSAIPDPGIVQVYDFGVTPSGTAYLIMEFLDGESLSARLRRRGVLSPSEAVRIARQVATSLHAAHAADIVHRDLKPENLFMVRDGEALGGERPKILDFGIAKLGDERRDRFRTRTGAVMGTPAYMSPEQCNDTGKIDHRTDIYSLGCVLFHLLTGRPPFDRVGSGEMIAAHLRETAPTARSIVPSIPSFIDPIVARCLEKSPDDRFQTMAELQQACDAALAELPPAPAVSLEPLPAPAVREEAVTTLGHSVGESSLHHRPVRMGLWVAVGAVAVVAGIVLAVATRSGSSAQPAAAPVQPAVSEPPAPPPPIVEPITPSQPEIAAPPPTAVGSAVEPSPPQPAKHPATKPKPPVKKHRDVYEDRF